MTLQDIRSDSFRNLRFNVLTYTISYKTGILKRLLIINFVDEGYRNPRPYLFCVLHLSSLLAKMTLQNVKRGAREAKASWVVALL